MTDTLTATIAGLAEPDILACPFCGGDASCVGYGPYRVVCKTCHASIGPLYVAAPNEAIAAWNRRPQSLADRGGEKAKPVAWRKREPAYPFSTWTYDTGPTQPRAGDTFEYQPLYAAPSTVEPVRVRELRRSLELHQIWLRSALDCKDWAWDGDQREAAEHAYAEGRFALQQPDQGTPK